MNLIIVFPGQGTQYVGMANTLKDLPLYGQIDASVGYALTNLMQNGPAEELKLTENTQPAIVAHSLLLAEKLNRILAAKNLKPKAVLGHSVGEYSALAFAGAISFADALRAVHYRGKFMQEASPQGKGTMYAILKQEASLIVESCQLASTTTEMVSAANFNEPSQIVISGDKPACERAIKIMEEKTGARVKAIELQVSAPFHSALMKPAEGKMSELFQTLSFKSNTIPYLANVDAQLYAADTEPTIIKKNLLEQICGSVLWTQSIQTLASDSIIIECGPGKVLAGLIKKINPELKVISLDTETGLQEVEAL